MIEVTKRNGKKTPFDREKIKVAIEKAMHSSNGIFVEGQAEKIAKEIEDYAQGLDTPLSIYDIEEQVYYKLIELNNPATARSYESYKSVQAYKREQNTTDEEILGLLNQTNLDVMNENSNKNAIIASTQRDLIAGEVSKDIAKRKMIPADLVEAHDSGAIHIHDMDYIIQPIFNCCLVNMKDMLDKGTVVNGKMIETPKSFQVACNVMTQIIAQIASNQYGGQSINISCLGKYLRRSYEKNLNLAIETLGDIELAQKMAENITKKTLKAVFKQFNIKSILL